LALPRVVGTDVDGEEITAQTGRYGPYIKKGAETRSLATEDQIFTVTLDEARQLLAQPKRGRGRATPAPPLRELGADPATGAPIVIKEGRYGPFVTDGETNASLKPAEGDSPDTVTLERAVALLSARREAAPAKRRRPAAKAAGKPAKTTKKAAKTTKKPAKKPAQKAAKSPTKGAPKDNGSGGHTPN
jgi:DNA topoisomerase-1